MLLNTLQLSLQFLHLIICFIPCTCISLGDSSELSGTPWLFILYRTSCSSNISSISCLCFGALLYFQLLFSAEPLCFLSLSLIFGLLVLLSIFTSFFSAGCNRCLVKIGNPKYWANQRHLLVYFLRSMACWHAQAVAGFFSEGREDAVYSEPAVVMTTSFRQAKWVNVLRVYI